MTGANYDQNQKTKTKHGMVPKNPSVRFALEAFRKTSIEANNLVDLKHQQEKAVNCLLKGRDVLGAMPRTILQLLATAIVIEKVHEGQHSATVVLMISLLPA